MMLLLLLLLPLSLLLLLLLLPCLHLVDPDSPVYLQAVRQ
jgi:hypothetical protein